MVIGVAAAMVAAVGGVAAVTAWACGGTPVFPCARTAYLAKWSPGTVVNPGPSSDILVPVGLLPYVAWNTGAPCVQPNGASLTLTLTCRPVGGGNPITVPAQAVPVFTPSQPGNQPVITGSGMTPVVGGVFNYRIPAGTLPAGNFVCTVRGEYRVDFPAGVGGGSLIGTGDATICIVEPSPADPLAPRFDVQLIDTGGEPFIRAAQGDQAYAHYLIANNDFDNAVVVNVTTDSNQVARTPLTVGGTLTQTIYSISAQQEDNFPQGDAGAQDFGQTVPGGDPLAGNEAQFDQVIALPPGGQTIVSIATSSYGMCPNGSCGENTFLAEARFSDGSAVTGCAGLVHQVDNSVRARDPLCVLFDTTTVGPRAEHLHTGAIFDGTHHQTTQFAGNDFLFEVNSPTTRLRGDVLESLLPPSDDDFPSGATDRIRVENPPSEVHWNNVVFDLNPQNQFETFGMSVTVSNLPPPPLTFTIPQIVPTGPREGVFDVTVDHNYQKGTWVIREGKKVIEKTTTDRLFGGSARNVAVDFAHSRTIGIECPNVGGIDLGTFPLSISSVVTQTGVFTETIDVFDRQTGDPVGWTATSNDPFIRVVSSSGSPGESIVIEQLPPPIGPGAVYTRTVGSLEIHSGSVPDDIQFVPIATAHVISSVIPYEDLFDASCSGKVDYKKPEAARDSLKCTFSLPVSDGFDFAGVPVVVDCGGASYGFELDAGGKGTPTEVGARKKKSSPPGPKRTFKLKAKKKKGKVVAGNAKATFTLKKADLGGILRDDGVRNATLKKDRVTIPIRVLFGDRTFETRLEVELSGKQGKTIKLKTPKKR